MELRFDLVKSVRCSRNKEVTYEAVLNNSVAQLSNLVDIRTSSRDSAEMIAKTVFVVRGMEVFPLVSRNPPQAIQEMNLALQSCALRADRSMLKSITERLLYKAMHDTPSWHSEATESALRAYLVDQRIQRNYS